MVAVLGKLLSSEKLWQLLKPHLSIDRLNLDNAAKIVITLEAGEPAKFEVSYRPFVHEATDAADAARATEQQPGKH